MHIQPPTHHTVLTLTVTLSLREPMCCGEEMTFEPLVCRPVCYNCGRKG